MSAEVDIMLARIFSNLVYLLKELGKVIPVTDEADDTTDDYESLQKQLEEQNALAEWRLYPTPYYEYMWIKGGRVTELKV